MSKKKSKSVTSKKGTPRYSEAGKGDTPRLGIALDEWEKRYEKIFRNKKERVIRPFKSNNSGSES